MAENNNMINNVAKDVIEEINENKSSNDLLKTIGAFAAGTTFGATCAVVGRKIINKFANGSELKAEIEQTKNAAKINKINKIEARIAAEQETLAKLKGESVEEPENPEVKEETGKKKTK